MIARQTCCVLSDRVAAIVSDHVATPDAIGRSGAGVQRLDARNGGGALYLKHDHGAGAQTLADEAARLDWLAAHVAVPRVVAFTREGDAAWLLTTALPGRTVGQALDEDPGAAPRIVDALARWLSRLHAVPAHDCPFDAGRALRLQQAQARMAAGLVDAEDFDDARAGWTPRQVWDAMIALPCLAATPVVTHGDCSLDNILLHDGEVSGCIDVGRAGLADRYQDLAILWNALGDHGAELQARLLARYGIETPEPARLQFHLMLDEFF